jgi:GTP cyclohydrolase II
MPRYDTVDANLALGFRDDERDYAVAAHMLFSLKVKSIQLMTNNPRKIENLTQHGVVVNGRIPVIIPPNPHNEFYLRTKAEKSGHLLDSFGKLHLQEQSDRPIGEGMNPEQIAEVHQEQQ